MASEWPPEGPIPGSRLALPTEILIRYQSGPGRSLRTTATVSERGLEVHDDWYDGDAECEVRWLVPPDRVSELLSAVPESPRPLVAFLRRAATDAAGASALISALSGMQPSVCTFHWLRPGDSFWGRADA